MRRLGRVIVIIVMSCSVASAGQDRASTAQPQTASTLAQWASVTSIMPGSPLRIRGFDGTFTNGELQLATSDRVTVLSRGATLDLQASAIREIDRQVGRSTHRGALTGLLVGVGVGILQGVLLVETNRDFWVPAFSAGWGGIGALAGGLYGRHQPKFVPVYRAP